MKQHIVSGVVAAAIAGGVAVAKPPKVTQVTHSIAVSKHAWPDLTDAQKTELSRRLGEIGKSIAILCGDAACTDLAQDIDDAAEDAKINSILDRPASPLGYGLGVQSDAFGKSAAEALASALRDVTGLQVEVATGMTLPQYPLFVLIGKHPRAPKA